MASASTSSTTVVPSGSTTAASTPALNASREQSEARTAVLASLTSAGQSYSNSLQTRATDLHNNAAALAKQETQLGKDTKALSKENAKLEKEVDKAMAGMKELGDMQNWAEMLERDFMVLEETVRLVEGGNEVDMESGGSTWK